MIGLVEICQITGVRDFQGYEGAFLKDPTADLLAVGDHRGDRDFQCLKKKQVLPLGPHTAPSEPALELFSAGAVSFDIEDFLLRLYFNHTIDRAGGDEFAINGKSCVYRGKDIGSGSALERRRYMPETCQILHPRNR